MCLQECLVKTREGKPEAESRHTSTLLFSGEPALLVDRLVACDLVVRSRNTAPLEDGDAAPQLTAWHVPAAWAPPMSWGMQSSVMTVGLDEGRISQMREARWSALCGRRWRKQLRVSPFFSP
ncbi:hypothetical protein CesoFtcFv8_024568 [Champsocephalus esox]|uniref:Uncharacterized protein n=1 Tax=Champsocephalus esox TaxID=159716 RepID=A0AAN8B623_9TELE|nr:hypothetical protein CesoFtcFv8_024568 [Champsocephalus esox]